MLADLAALALPPALAGVASVRVRPPARADLRGIELLLDAAAAARDRPPTLRREDLELRWLQLADPREAAVVLVDDAVVAYASASPDLDPNPDRHDHEHDHDHPSHDHDHDHPSHDHDHDRPSHDDHDDASHVTVHLDLQIHPAWTGRGLGTRLLDLSLEVGRCHADPSLRTEIGRRHADRAPTVVRVRTALTDGTDVERRWFADRGFRPHRHLLDLHLDLHAPPPAPRWPADVHVRTFRPGEDDRVLWGVHQRAFADVATHLPIALDDLLRDRAPSADPALVLLAEHLDASARAEVVGILIGKAGTEVAATDGWVRDLAVLPGWRRRGIAMALLRTGFAAFRARGLRGVALEVDDVTLEGAVALYRRAGMRVTRRTDVLERPG